MTEYNANKNIDSIVSVGKGTDKQITYDDFIKSNEYGKPTGIYDYKVVEHIRNCYKIKIVDQTPYIFDCGLFRADHNGTTLKNLIRECIYPPLLKSTTVKRIYDLFFMYSDISLSFDDMNIYPKHFINFKDGFLDSKTLKIDIPHPKFLATNQIPYDWGSIRTAEPVNNSLDNFFSEIFESAADKEMFLQFAGLCFTRDTRQQKFMIIQGEGGTGKSVLIDLVQTAVGSDNVSNVSLEDLQQRFSTFSLRGKLLNSCADLKISVLDNPAKLKQLTGEDSMTAEQKGKDLVSFKNYSKQLFSINALPYIKNENTGAFYRRLMILKINKKPVKPDIELSAKLKENILYFIRLSVEALNRMYTQYDGKVAESKNSLRAVEEMRERNDVVQAFINSELKKEVGTYIDRDKLYQMFVNYCIKNERASLPKSIFYDDMRNKGYTAVKHENINCFKDIQSKEPFEPRCDSFIQ